MVDNSTTEVDTRYADPDILSSVPRVELREFPNLQRDMPVGSGAYGDVFKCRAVMEGQGEIYVAAKLPRFHVNLLAVRRVSAVYAA